MIMQEVIPRGTGGLGRILIPLIAVVFLPLVPTWAQSERKRLEIPEKAAPTATQEKPESRRTQDKKSQLERRLRALEERLRRMERENRRLTDRAPRRAPTATADRPTSRPSRNARPPRPPRDRELLRTDSAPPVPQPRAARPPRAARERATDRLRAIERDLDRARRLGRAAEAAALQDALEDVKRSRTARDAANERAVRRFDRIEQELDKARREGRYQEASKLGHVLEEAKREFQERNDRGRRERRGNKARATRTERARVALQDAKQRIQVGRAQLDSLTTKLAELEARAELARKSGAFEKANALGQRKLALQKVIQDIHAQNQQILDRSKQLLESVWDVASDISDRLQTRTVDMHVRRLRDKLGEAGGRIRTIRGFGYRLEVPKGM